MTPERKIILLIAVSLTIIYLMAGCASPGSIQSLAPVCEAVGAPHVYNSHNKDSLIHAGPILAKRLVRDNQVGTGLHCKGY